MNMVRTVTSTPIVRGYGVKAGTIYPGFANGDYGAQLRKLLYKTEFAAGPPSQLLPSRFNSSVDPNKVRGLPEAKKLAERGWEQVAYMGELVSWSAKDFSNHPNINEGTAASIAERAMEFTGFGSKLRTRRRVFEPLAELDGVDNPELVAWVSPVSSDEFKRELALYPNSESADPNLMDASALGEDAWQELEAMHDRIYSAVVDGIVSGHLVISWLGR